MANPHPKPPLHGQRARTRPRDIIGWHRGVKALELRLTGLSWAKIAKEIGYANEGSAWKAAMRTIEAMAKEPAEAVRRITVARLNVALRAIWPGVEQGDRDDIAMMLKIEDQRCRVEGVYNMPAIFAMPGGTVNVGPGAGGTVNALALALPAFSSEEERHEYLRQCAFVLAGGARGALPAPDDAAAAVTAVIDAVEEGAAPGARSEETGASGNGRGSAGGPG